MGLFEISINVIESLLLAYVIFKHHKFKYNEQYLLLTSIIFIEEMISSYIDSQNRVILVIVPLTLFIYQLIRLKRFLINDLLISVMSLLFVSFSNVIALFVMQFVFDVEYFPGVIIFSKIVCFSLMHYYTSNMHIGDKEFPQVWQFNLVVIALIAIMDIDIQGIMDGAETGLAVYVRIIVIAFLVLLLYRFLRQLINDANDKMQYELEIQEVKYKAENDKLIAKTTEELSRLEHNLKYLLMTILFHAGNNDIQAIEEQANSYLGKVTKANHIVATNNPYFDYLFNEVSYYFKLNNIILKKNISLSKNSNMNSMLMTDKVIHTTKKILDIAIENEVDVVDIKIEEDGFYYFIYYLLPYENYEAMKRSLEENFNEEYRVNFKEKYKTVHISFVLDFDPEP